MKKLLWMLLAALPMQAMANEEDPIAYKCYYCTPDEMEDVALAQGVGRHYVYDAENLIIVGFDVAAPSGNLIASPFEAEDWVKTQFKGMMGIYNPSDGSMKAWITKVALLAPDSDHGRKNQRLWGHHLTALNPVHDRAREVVRRFLKASPELAFLDTTTSEGKLLRFKYMMDDESRPIIVTLHFDTTDPGFARFFFDHSTREWHFLDAKDRYPIQQDWSDFGPQQGNNYFNYASLRDELSEAFVKRAMWASVPVHGSIPEHKDVQFRCERKVDDIQCHIE